MRTALRIALCFTLLPSLPCQSAPKVVGDWQGSLQAAQTLRLTLHVTEDGDRLRGSLDSIDQGVNGIPIETIERKGHKLSFAMKSLRARFVGTVSADGESIEGVWHQGGSLPLVFRRGEAPKLSRPQMPKPPFPYRITKVRFGHLPSGAVAETFTTDVEDLGEDAVVLAGTLTIPAGKGPFPAAVLVSGSGPQDRDETLMGHKPFWVLADFLSRRGIAVLRYDDRGTAESTGRFATATSVDLADDAEAGFRFLRQRPEVAAAKVGLIGHSEGGLIAPMVAVRDPKVAYLVLLAGPGRSGEAIIRLQSRLIATANGAKAADLDLADRANAEVFDTLREEKDPSKLRAALSKTIRGSLEALDPATRAQLGNLDQVTRARVENLLTPWMRYFLAYDPAPTLAKVRCPVLAINGELDLQVDPEQNLPAIEAALAKGGNKDFVVRRLSGLNHLFQHAKTGSPSEYAKIEETFDEAAMELIVTFLKKRFAR